MLFRQVTGQEEAIQKVREAILGGKMPHALMLTGPSGVGKFSLATAIAQYVNCLHPTETDACGTCPNCHKIQKAIHPDLHFVLPIVSSQEGGKPKLSEDYMEEFREAIMANPYLSLAQWQALLEGDSKQLIISVHEIRELKRKIYLKAFEGKYKIVILWQAERMNVQASNAFLKLLEEPPDQTLVLMTTHQPDALLNTIRSRCQRLPLRRLSPTAIQRYLMELYHLPQDEAIGLAGISEGSLGAALELRNEATQQFTDQYANWLRAVYAGNYAKITEQIASLIDSGKEAQRLFLALSLRKVRDSLLFNQGASQIALTMEKEREFQQKFAPLVDAEKVEHIREQIEESIRQIGGNAHPGMVFSALSMEIHRILRN